MPRLLAPFALAALVLTLGVPERARASSGTHVSGTISQNTTWTFTNSPYVVDGNITVQASATLTIEPGVVVKLSGQTRTIFVDGVLTAIGTPSSHIVFTSIQDDEVLGDTGADGPTAGAPGQWYSLYIRSPPSSPSRLQYADVLYGGYGSIAWNYGAVTAAGSAGTVIVEDSNVLLSQRSGVLVGANGSATVRRTAISGGENGVSVNMGTAYLDRAVVSENSLDGVWFNLTSFYTGPASSILDSDILGNGRYGAYLQIDRNLATSRWPFANRSNIYDNGSGEDQQQLQLTGYHPSSTPWYAVDWTTNFWGDMASYWTAPPACGLTSPFSTGHVSFSTSTANPPAGPIAYSNYFTGTMWCPYDRFQIGSSGFAGDYQPAEPTLTTQQEQTAISLAESDPRVVSLLAGRPHSASATAWMTVAQPANLIGGLVTLSWDDPATLTTDWPAIDYDETEQTSPPYTEGTISYTGTGAESLDILVDLTRNAVVSIEPGVEAERTGSGLPLSYLARRFDPGGGTDLGESQGVPTGRMRKKCFFGDCFFNYDFAEELIEVRGFDEATGRPYETVKRVPKLHPKNADNPIGLVFKGNADVDRVKNRLEDVGFTIDATWGTPMYAYIVDDVDPGEPRWDKDEGVKDDKCASFSIPPFEAKRDRHVRVYGGADDQIESFSTQWGFYVIASAHFDVNECPFTGTTWHGKSEVVENYVATRMQQMLGFAVLHDITRLGNAENWEDSKCAAPVRGKHRRCNDGYATQIEVP